MQVSSSIQNGPVGEILMPPLLCAKQTSCRELKSSSEFPCLSSGLFKFKYKTELTITFPQPSILCPDVSCLPYLPGCSHPKLGWWVPLVPQLRISPAGGSFLQQVSHTGPGPSSAASTLEQPSSTSCYRSCSLSSLPMTTPLSVVPYTTTELKFSDWV